MRRRLDGQTWPRRCPPFHTMPRHAPTIAQARRRASLRPGAATRCACGSRARAHAGGDGSRRRAGLDRACAFVMNISVHAARLSYACRKRIRSRCRAPNWRFPRSTAVERARPGAERGTVNRMLPDFRFVLGAILAITLLAVAGLGLVTSVRLVQEARINPIEDARSLAFAGHAQWNRSYDPEGARRFEDWPARPRRPRRGSTRRRKPADLVRGDRATGLRRRPRRNRPPASGRQPDPVVGRCAGARPRPRPPEKAPASGSGPHATCSRGRDRGGGDEPGPAEGDGGQAPDVPAPTGSVAPPTEQVASAPAALPEEETQTETRSATQMPPQETALAPSQAAADPPPDSSPATPQAATEPPPDSSPPNAAGGHRSAAGSLAAHPAGASEAPFAKTDCTRAQAPRRPASPQPTQNSGLPLASPPSSSQSWPGYDNQFTGATARKRTPASSPEHPQTARSDPILVPALSRDRYRFRGCYGSASSARLCASSTRYDPGQVPPRRPLHPQQSLGVAAENLDLVLVAQRHRLHPLRGGRHWRRTASRPRT